MMTEMLAKVVAKLAERTEAGKVQWEDITSSILGSDMFQTRLAETTVQIREGEFEQESDEYGTAVVKYYKIEVINLSGYVVDQRTAEVDDHDYKRLATLFEAARASARRRKQVLENLLVELGR